MLSQSLMHMINKAHNRWRRDDSRPGSAEKKPPDPDTNPVYVGCDVAPQWCIGPTGAILQAGQHWHNDDTKWIGTQLEKVR